MKFVGRIIKMFRDLFLYCLFEHEKTQFLSHGDNFSYNGGFFSFKNIQIGNDVFIGEGANFISEDAKIIIGNNVMFGPRVTIVTGDHRMDVIGEHMSNIKEKRPQDDQDVVVEDDVWIGTGAIILKGVTIGTGAVVGAGSVVVKSVPPYCVCVGNTPRKVFKRFSVKEQEEHEKLLKEKHNG